jgi:hypothetical protein
MKYSTSLLAALALSTLCTTGCGAAYQASAGTRFDVEGGREINDEDVKAAFDASPQVGLESKVAYYTFDDQKTADIEAMLKKTPHVTSVYKIPPLLVTGQRHFQETDPWHPQEVSVKKLRVLAARAHADILVVFDHGWRGGGANGLAALNILIVPMLFTPWLDNTTESYAQAFVIDVRNGYLYGDFTTETKSGDRFVTIYGNTPRDVAEEQWPKLLTDVQSKVAQKLTPSEPAHALSEAD